MTLTEITATEAVREFADILDAVEHRGEHFRIARRGRPIALLSPVSDKTAAAGTGKPGWLQRRSKAADTTRQGLREIGAQPGLGLVAAVLRPDAARAELLPSLLQRLQAIGCELAMPGGEFRRDYVNVMVASRRGRVLSVNASTGRAEFQTDSWDRVHALSKRFVRLAAGNKAAHPLETRMDLDVIVAAARAEMRTRG